MFSQSNILGAQICEPNVDIKKKTDPQETISTDELSDNMIPA